MSKTISDHVYWYGTKALPRGRALSKAIETTVVVIGGGVAGLSCAQRFQEAGVPVVLLERDFCGAGASGKTSGFVTPDSEIELSSLLSTYGPKKAKQIWEFACEGVEHIRANIETYKIACDYQVQDSLFIANNSKGFKHISEEHAARKKLGYASQLFDAASIQKLVGSTQYHGAVHYPDTFGMNSYLYCQGMKKILEKAGVKIFENTNVDRIEGKIAFTSKGKVTAEHIVVCGDRFIPDLGILKKEIYHVQTFLGITKPLKEDQVKALFPQAPLMTWDTDLVYNYFRITGDRRLLIGGGDLFYTYAKNESKNTQRFAKRLTRYIQKKFPTLSFELESVWPGMLGVSKDLLPIMGPGEKNKAVWYVGAATGLPWAAALGTYAADHILKNRHEFDKIFSTERHFTIDSPFQTLLGNPVTYALSHGIAKYF